MPAGRLNHRLSFQQRQLVSGEEYGNEQGDFAEEFMRWAQIEPSRGIETVSAARLVGQQPVDISVRRDSGTLQIAADWRAVDVNDGTIYALTSPPSDRRQTRQYLTMTAVVGIAA